MPPDRYPTPAIATDEFWDAFSTTGEANSVAVDPADVVAIQFIHTHPVSPEPSIEFSGRLRSALLSIGTSDDDKADLDEPARELGIPPLKPAMFLPEPVPLERNRRSWPILAAALLALFVGGAAIWTLVAGDSQPGSIPAIVPPVESTSTIEASLVTGLPSIELPADSIPWSRFGVTFDHRSMPPLSESEDASDDSLKLRMLLSGSVDVQSDGHMRVRRVAGNGTWEEARRGAPVRLESGDAIFVDDGASISFVNNGTAAAEFIAWSLSPGGGQHGEVPPGWALYYQDFWHIVSLANPDTPVRLSIQKTELVPSGNLEPPPAALIHQFVYLPQNSAGEQVAPILGSLPDGGTRNLGRQALTIYDLVIEPVSAENQGRR